MQAAVLDAMKRGGGDRERVILATSSANQLHLAHERWPDPKFSTQKKQCFAPSKSIGNTSHPNDAISNPFWALLLNGEARLGGEGGIINAG